MSLAWVILGHTSLVETSAFDNIAYLLDRSTNILFQTLTNGTLSVDTFFVLGGLLVMLGGLRSMEKLENPCDLKFWALFYIHRLVRLWPTMILGIFFVFAFVPLMSQFTYSAGYQPYYPDGLIDSCENVGGWTSAVFFYSNFYFIKNLPCIGKSTQISKFHVES